MSPDPHHAPSPVSFASLTRLSRGISTCMAEDILLVTPAKADHEPRGRVIELLRTVSPPR
jgi:hypothetical protein